MELMLCTDLDRTIVPNGPEMESSEARPRFRRLVHRPEVTLAYVTGRDEKLVRRVIDEFDLPTPEYVIGDVGSTIYEVRGRHWTAWWPWTEEIGPDWGGARPAELADLLADIDGLELQEPEKQGRYKLSYYAPADTVRDRLLDVVRSRLEARGVRASLIWSIDQLENVGLFDILPERATKVHAIRFLMDALGSTESRTVFAGDSGNDLEALTSGLPAVLVKNAREEVRREALRIVEERGLGERLYLARGDFHSMNGCYSAGVLEGVAHFHPETEAWMGLG